MSRELVIRKRGGKVESPEEVHRWLDGALALMPNGERVLTLAKPRERRSLNQNAIFWLWMRCIEEETGQSKDDAHDWFCKKFLRRTVTFNGREETVVGGTSSLTREQMSEFLDRVQAEAASELGIRLPSPDDEAWAAFEEYYRGRL